MPTVVFFKLEDKGTGRVCLTCSLRVSKQLQVLSWTIVDFAAFNYFPLLIYFDNLINAFKGCG